jgi:hypothetical protein
MNLMSSLSVSLLEVDEEGEMGGVVAFCNSES